MTKAENLIDLTARTEDVALDVTARLVPSPVGLMDNETARALIHQAVLDGVAAVLNGATGRWEHTIEVAYPSGHAHNSGRYRQRQRAINELARLQNPNGRYARLNTHGVVQTIKRRAIFEGPWQDA